MAMRVPRPVRAAGPAARAANSVPQAGDLGRGPGGVDLGPVDVDAVHLPLGRLEGQVVGQQPVAAAHFEDPTLPGAAAATACMGQVAHRTRTWARTASGAGR